MYRDGSELFYGSSTGEDHTIQVIWNHVELPSGPTSIGPTVVARSGPEAGATPTTLEVILSTAHRHHQCYKSLLIAR